LRLTDLSLRQLKAPVSGAKVYADDTLVGFGVRVSFQGTASFVLTYGVARKRVTIGRVGVISLKDARLKARELLAERTLGKKDLKAVSFETAQQLFHTTRAAKESTKKETKRALDRHFLPKWRNEKVADITTDDVADIVDRLKHTPSEQGHAFAAARLFFNWCEKRRYIDRSPLHGLDAPKLGKSRSRVLSDAELIIVLRTALNGATPFHKLVALLLLTGQRRSQIAALERKWIGHNTRLFTFPAEIMKGNRDHVTPFGDLTASVLATLSEDGLLFPGGDTDNPFSAFSKSKTGFDKECGVTNWTLHDLRRTMRTHFAKLKVPPHIGERILDHRSGVVSEVEAIYDRYEYLDEMRQAVEAYEAHLVALCEN